ncbi:protein phosphatase 1 regulatory subunit 21 [Microplitis mediator]|uniref:protein phosphatase 1 regulatory subunit 21 n=1 Tax=Microplitis mediator TaxID=375433 RepID=UPI0025541F4C|nr:protein phosphatase 1 regulatory subunit 21 [Microplitis mediator]
MEGVNGQLQTKYQKVVAEYSKIRAQASVLKKAVIDEQTRNSELKEQLKEKDVSLRRAEQELDSLIFRNQQLTKRVTVLQDELDKSQNKSKKGKSKSSENKDQPPPPPPNHVYVEEFKKKIVENAQLQSVISDKDNEIDELSDRIKHLEYKLDLSEKSRIELDSKYQDKIDKLERDKNELIKKLNDRQKHDETVSWSSIEGKWSYDCDLKTTITNHRQVDHSPFSSPSVSRRSSKSIGDIRLQKTPDYQDDTNNEFEYSKIYDLEKELSQYKSDYYILKNKYDELQEKNNYILQQTDSNNLESVEINNMIGSLKAPFALPDEIEAREAKIKDYFQREIDKLITEKQIYHAKNLAIAASNQVMSVHLDTSEEKRKKCETALLEALSNWTSSQEDKEVQEGSYTSQLSTMTEHLANMNEKLIQQTEEIQQLKYELSNKNEKKGKQK